MARLAGRGALEADLLVQLAELDFLADLAAGLRRPGFDWLFPGFEQAFHLYEAAGHRRGMADVRLRLGRCLVNAGLDGRSHLRQAQALYQEDGDSLGVSEVLSGLTFAHRLQGDLLAARQESEQAEALAQQLQVPMLRTATAMWRGDAAFLSGDIDRALAHLEPDIAPLPASAALTELLQLNMAGKPHTTELARAAELPPDARSTELLIRANKAAHRQLWDEALRLADEGARFDLERGQWWEAVSKIELAIMAVLMRQRRPEGGFPAGALAEAGVRLARAFGLVRDPENGNQFAAVAELHALAQYVYLLAADYARALHHGTAVIGAYKTLGRRMQQAFATAKLGLVYHGLAKKVPALYEAAIERYTEALVYYREQDVRAEVWRVSGLLAQALFRSPIGGGSQPGDPGRGIGAALGVLEEAYALYNQVRRRFIPAGTERPEPGQAAGSPSPQETPALCVFLAVFGQQPSAAWTWAERFKSRAFLDDLARTPLPPPADVPAELLVQEKELLQILNGGGAVSGKIQAADQLHALYAAWATDGIAEEYRSLRLGEPTPWATIQELLSDPAEAHQESGGGVVAEE
jgi:tetratricopeptide (TPR) repeat protein